MTDRLRLQFYRMLLTSFLRDARLTLRCPAQGFVLTAGRKGKDFTVEIDSLKTLHDIIRAPDPRLGEAFMDRRWILRNGDLGQFLTTLACNAQRLLAGPFGAIFAKLLQGSIPDKNHDPEHSRHHAAHHYDLGNDLYALFLDEGMNYSCAFFSEDAANLRAAQLNKVDAVITRLGIEPGMSVLDIGCGWGEAASIVAQKTSARVTGITLARRQLEIARARMARHENLRFYLEDYRDHARTHTGAYDRIYSIGMFEHVGADSYNTYFTAIRDQLAPGGRALVHAIVTGNGATRHGKLSCLWLEKYIFPGGEICHVDTMLDAAAEAGLTPVVPSYIEPSSSYAETLRCWRANFMRNAQKLDRNRYDDRFCRMWIYYLAMCEAMFDGCGFQVAQIVFRPSERRPS